MATMCSRSSRKFIIDLIYNEEMPYEGIGALLTEVGNEFGLAVSVFTPTELGDAVSIEAMQDTMIAAGNNLLSSYQPA